MISITSAQLNAWLAAFIWPFFRILALISSAPVLGNPGVPVRVRIGLAFAITIVVSPVLGPMPQVEPGSAAGVMIAAQQVVIGLAMGLAMRIVFTAVEMAGHFAGLQMGLGFATFFDPQNSAQTPVMAQFLSLLALLVFLAINGHLLVIEALVQSFRDLPISAQPLSPLGWKALAAWGKAIFLAGLVLSMPVVASLLIINISIGIMTRAAPQLNIFAVGFPITLVAGFLVLALALPFIMPVIERLIHDGIEMSLQVVRLLRPVSP
jgi:flagellar biosynthetic protein FliR